MNVTFPRSFLAHAALLTLGPALLFAGTPDPVSNLLACKKGWPSCDTSRLTLTEKSEVTRADRARNVWNCTNGLNSCDHSKLNEAEAIALAVALYDRNVSTCRDGLTPCDHSRLTASEAREVGLAERRISDCKDGTGLCDASTLTELEVAAVDVAVRGRNMPDCKDGRDCDFSNPSRSEAATPASAERTRNYQACLTRRGYCDRSRLTPSQAAAIPREPSPNVR